MKVSELIAAFDEKYAAAEEERRLQDKIKKGEK